MIRSPIKQQTRWFLNITSILILIGLYSFLSYRQHVINPHSLTIPNLSQFIDGWKMLLHPQHGRSFILNDLIATYERHLTGFALGVIASLIIGIAMGCYPKIESLFELPLSIFSRIPPTAMMAFYFMIFGIGNEYYYAVIALGIFPILTQTICQSVKKDVPEYYVEKAYTLGASTMEVIYNVVYKQILPRIIEGIRMQVGPAMIFLIAAETFNASVGVGYRLRMESKLSNMNIVYTYLAILALSGYLMDYSLIYLRRKLCPWFGD